MPSGGHNRKPTALKLLAGTAQPCRMKNEPKPQPVAPKCPSRLPKEAKRKWKELAPKLEKLGLLTQVDGGAFADLCLCLARLAEAEQSISINGLLVPAKDGLKRNPALQTAREYRQAVARWYEKFGLTPADRGRLDMPAARERDEDDDFFAYKREKKQGK